MSGINRGSRHKYEEDVGVDALLERIRQAALSADEKREQCQCRNPVRLRKYGGQWVCALCVRFMVA